MARVRATSSSCGSGSAAGLKLKAAKAADMVLRQGKGRGGEGRGGEGSGRRFNQSWVERRNGPRPKSSAIPIQ